MNILFVCSGNTCRSPMAAYLADDIARKQFPECGFRFDSAGIATSDGYPATDHAVEALAELGIDGSDHRSKAFQPYMVERSDRIVCMTAMHKQALCHAFPAFADKIFVIGELSGTGKDIPDPYMGSLSLYCLTRDKLKEEITLILERCKNV
ncbi:MAG: low molecular weight protein arginine phosphatase [Firmicutes bacterium]|nr:low molecular weight protein arginine phosphatase [Bacillota bacterium]